MNPQVEEAMEQAIQCLEISRGPRRQLKACKNLSSHECVSEAETMPDGLLASQNATLGSTTVS